MKAENEIESTRDTIIKQKPYNKIVFLIFVVLLVCFCSFGALAYDEPYLNEHGGDRLDPDDSYSEITQNDSESTDGTDIVESADTIETDLDEWEKEILRNTVSQFLESRAGREKEAEKKLKRMMAKRDIAIVFILLITKPAIALAKKITNKNR